MTSSMTGSVLRTRFVFSKLSAKLDTNNRLHKILLSGIDAPERGQPYGSASRDHLAALVAGKEVRVEASKQDRYGRTVGKVWVQPSDCTNCGKTLDANLAQVTDGMAWW